MKHALPLLLLAACGAQELAAPGEDTPAFGTTASALSAVSDARAVMKAYGGDPGGYDLIVRLAIDDAELRQALPNFDGYEKVRVWIPSWDGSWHSFRPYYVDTQNGKDNYYGIVILHQGQQEATRKNGVWIDIETNAGDLKGVAHLIPKASY